jgi:crotonobetainyl-CoA:carnitine CoA-transferase CaiB-like acyl-CoA transferase
LGQQDDDRLRRARAPGRAGAHHGVEEANEWQDFFLELSLPGSPLLSVEELLESSHLAARGLLEWAEDHGGLANVPRTIRWIDQGGGRPGARPRPAPRVGDDTDEVLATWLGR